MTRLHEVLATPNTELLSTRSAMVSSDSSPGKLHLRKHSVELLQLSPGSTGNLAWWQPNNVVLLHPCGAAAAE